jgi:hypothetical protein
MTENAMQVSEKDIVSMKRKWRNAPSPRESVPFHFFLIGGVGKNDANSQARCRRARNRIRLQTNQNMGQVTWHLHRRQSLRGRGRPNRSRYGAALGSWSATSSGRTRAPRKIRSTAIPIQSSQFGTGTLKACVGSHRGWSEPGWLVIAPPEKPVRRR